MTDHRASAARTVGVDIQQLQGPFQKMFESLIRPTSYHVDACAHVLSMILK